MENLSINIADLTKIVCEKIEKAVGFIYDPFGNKHESRQQLVSRIKSLNLPPLEEAALISKANKIIKEYINQNDILQIALDNLNLRQTKEQQKMYEMDDDFLSRFFDSAKHISNDEAKLIWGHILSKEIQSPGSISKQLIHILSTIEPKHAELFSVLCKYTLVYSNKIHKDLYEYDVIPFIDINESTLDYWALHNVTYKSLRDLQSKGLIFFNEEGEYNIYYDGYISSGDRFNFIFEYYGDKIEVKSNKVFIPLDDVPIKNINVKNGKVIYTDLGISLMKAIDIDVDFNTKSMCLPHIMQYVKSQGFQVLYNSPKLDKDIK